MGKFGVIKTKILKKLTESYINNKHEVKTLLNLIKENKDFKELYLFYEEIENKYIEDKEDAILYVEQIKPILREKTLKINEFLKTLDLRLKDVEINENKIYDSLDLLIEDDNKLVMVEKKIKAKKIFIEHLTTKKEIIEDKVNTIVENENLLYALLANNFNVLYNNTLNESDKIELQKILSLSNDELNGEISELKENVLSKVNNILNESTDDALNEKLNNVKNEVSTMESNKFNYYRLVQLKNGFD
jgi:hypothetical protein